MNIPGSSAVRGRGGLTLRLGQDCWPVARRRSRSFLALARYFWRCLLSFFFNFLSAFAASHLRGASDGLLRARASVLNIRENMPSPGSDSVARRTLQSWSRGTLRTRQRCSLRQQPAAASAPRAASLFACVGEPFLLLHLLLILHTDSLGAPARHAFD